MSATPLASLRIGPKALEVGGPALRLEATKEVMSILLSRKNFRLEHSPSESGNQKRKGLSQFGITPLCLVPRAGVEPARWGTTEGF